jgi:Cu(I)/Ag(I) efflux system membrane fusion protein
MKRTALILLAAMVVVAVSVYFLKYRITTSVSDEAPREEQATTADAEAGADATGGPAEPAAEEETAEEEVPEVEIPLEMQQLMGVKTAAVAMRPLDKVIRTVGRLDYNERGLATVNTKIEGWIEKLYINYTGRYVNKGERMAEIYSPELIAAQEEHLVALKWAKDGGGGPVLKDAQALLEASRRRLRLWDISEGQIEEIERTGEVRRTLTIYSPVSGYVIEKTALEGMRVMAGEKLFDVADLSTIWMLADIYEYELPLVRQNDKVKVRLGYLSGKEFESRIDYVYPTLSKETRTAKVRIVMKNPGTELKPNMFADMELRVPLGKRLSVPEGAVIDTGVRRIVYVDKGEGYFEPREVHIGQRAEGFVEVLLGLSEGEKVAASGNFLIDSEAQFRGVKPLPLKKRNAR